MLQACLAMMTEAVRARLAGGTVLDLMSSWVSHLPEDRRFAKVVGHGMNAAEAGAFPYCLSALVMLRLFFFQSAPYSTCRQMS